MSKQDVTGNTSDIVSLEEEEAKQAPQTNTPSASSSWWPFKGASEEEAEKLKPEADKTPAPEIVDVTDLIDEKKVPTISDVWHTFSSWLVALFLGSAAAFSIVLGGVSILTGIVAAGIISTPVGIFFGLATGCYALWRGLVYGTLAIPDALLKKLPNRVRIAYTKFLALAMWKKVLIMLSPLVLITMVAVSFTFWKRHRALRKKELRTSDVFSYIKGATLLVGGAGVITALSDLNALTTITDKVRDVLSFLGLMKMPDHESRNILHKTIKVHIDPNSTPASVQDLLDYADAKYPAHRGKPVLGAGNPELGVRLALFHNTDSEVQHAILDDLEDAGYPIHVTKISANTIAIEIGPKPEEWVVVNKLLAALKKISWVPILSVTFGILLVATLIFFMVGMIYAPGTVFKYFGIPDFVGPLRERLIGSSTPHVEEVKKNKLITDNGKKSPAVDDKKSKKDKEGRHDDSDYEYSDEDGGDDKPQRKNKASKGGVGAGRGLGGKSTGSKGSHIKTAVDKRVGDGDPKAWHEFYRLMAVRDLLGDWIADQVHGDGNSERVKNARKTLGKLSARLHEFYDAGYAADEEKYREYLERYQDDWGNYAKSRGRNKRDNGWELNEISGDITEELLSRKVQAKAWASKMSSYQAKLRKEGKLEFTPGPSGLVNWYAFDKVLVAVDHDADPNKVKLAAGDTNVKYIPPSDKDPQPPKTKASAGETAEKKKDDKGKGKESSSSNPPMSSGDFEERVAHLKCGPEYPKFSGTLTKLSFGGKKYFALTAHQAQVGLKAAFKGVDYPKEKNIKDLPWVNIDGLDLAYLPASELSIPGLKTLPVYGDDFSSGACCLVGYIPSGEKEGQISTTPCDAEAGPSLDFVESHNIYHNASTDNGSCGSLLLYRGGAVGLHYMTVGTGKLPNVAVKLVTPPEKEARPPATWKLPPGELQTRPTEYSSVIKNGVYLGHLPAKLQLPEKAGFTLKPSTLLDHLPAFFQNYFADPEFAGTKGSRKNVDIAIRKLDGVGISGAPDSDPAWDTAEAMCAQLFSIPLHQRVSTWDEAAAGMNRSTSPGYPYTAAGFRKKGDVVDRPEFKEYAYTFPSVFFRIAWKFEWKSILEIMADKIRTFATGPLHFYMFQTMLFGRQNDAMQQQGWSSHGFNPFMGGFHKLALSLLAYPFRVMRDWSGWDRYFYLMRRVYKIRVAALKEAMGSAWTDEHQRMADYVVENLCHVKYIFPDGSVWCFPWSNPSGQGATTEDNILGHAIVEFYLMLLANPGATYEACASNFIKLYGDDHIGGYGEQFAKMGDTAWMTTTVAEKLKIPLKVLIGGRDFPLEGLSFLGASFRKLPNDYWVPLYSEERIRSAFAHNIKKVPADVELSKMYSLMLLAWPHGGLFEILRSAFAGVVTALGDDPRAKIFQRIGIPTHAQMLYFYTGLESTDVETQWEGLKIFLQEVGGHKSVPMNGKGKQKQSSPKADFSLEGRASALSQKLTALATYGGGIRSAKASSRPGPRVSGARGDGKKGGSVSSGAVGNRVVDRQGSKLGKVAGPGAVKTGAGATRSSLTAADASVVQSWADTHQLGHVVHLPMDDTGVLKPNSTEELVSHIASNRIKHVAQTKTFKMSDLPSNVRETMYRGGLFRGRDASKQTVVVYPRTIGSVSSLAQVANLPNPTLPVDPKMLAAPHTVEAGDGGNEVMVVEHGIQTNPMSSHEVSGFDKKYSQEGEVMEGDDLLAEITVPPAIGGFTTTIPVGGQLANVLCNPRFQEGSPFGDRMKMYDQFRIDYMEFEYVPSVSVMTSGTLIAAFIPDCGDPMLRSTGFAAIRDSNFRPGSVMFNVAQRAWCRISKPLMKWYFTGSQALPELEFPGSFVVQTCQALSNATATSIPLGMLKVREKFIGRNEAMNGPAPQVWSTSTATLNMTNRINPNSPGTAVVITQANTGLPSNLLQDGVVYEGFVAALDDSGPTQLWRNWTDTNNNENVVISNGMPIYWKTIFNANGLSNVYFFPDPRSATAAGSFYLPAYVYTYVSTNTTCGFKLYSISAWNTEGNGE